MLHFVCHQGSANKNNEITVHIFLNGQSTEPDTTEWCGATETLIHCRWECKMVQPLSKLNTHLPYDPVIAFLSIYLGEINTYSHKYLCMTVHNSFICNSQKVEITKISFKKRMVKQTVVCVHLGILLSNWREWTIHTGNILNRSQGHYAKVFFFFNLKKLHIVWFHLYHTFEMKKL